MSADRSSRMCNGKSDVPRLLNGLGPNKAWLVSALLVGLLATLPIWLTTYPPMVDLPQYAAQVAMFNQILAGGWAFADLFSVDLFTPYLTAFFLIWLLEPITGMVMSVKLVVALALFGLPVSTAILVKEFDGDQRWSWLVAPASYGFAFNWGFLNFLVAAPIGMLYLVAVSRYARNPSPRFGLGIAALTHLLFFSHVLPLFFFGLLGGLLIMIRARSVIRAVVAILPLLSLAPAGLGWGLPSLAGPQVQADLIWDLRWSRILDIPELVLGTGKSIGYGLLFVSLLFIPFFGGAQLTRTPERYVPLVLCLLVLLFVPNLVAGTFFTYQRFAIFLIPLALLVIDRAPSSVPIGQRKLAGLGAVAIAVAWVGTTTLRFHAYERESADFRMIMRQMEPRNRILSMVFLRDSPFSVAPIYLHYPVWYQAESQGLVDFSFARFQGYPVHYRLGDDPAADDRFVWQPYSFTWSEHRKFGYRYILSRAGDGIDDAPLGVSACDELSLVSKMGAWWLYDSERQGPRPEACPRVHQ